MKTVFNQWTWSVVVVALLAYSFIAIGRMKVDSYSLKLNQAPIQTQNLELGKNYQLVVINTLTVNSGGAEVVIDATRKLNPGDTWEAHDWLKIDDVHRLPDLTESQLFRYTYEILGEGKPVKVSLSSFDAQMVDGELVVVLYETL